MPIQPPAGVQAGAEFMNQYQQNPRNQVLPQGVQAGADFMNQYQQSPNNQVLPAGVQAGADWMNQYQQQPENQAPPPQAPPPPSAPPAQMAEILRASDYQMPQGQGGYFEPMKQYSKGAYGDPRAIPEAPPPPPLPPPEEAALPVEEVTEEVGLDPLPTEQPFIPPGTPIGNAGSQTGGNRGNAGFQLTEEQKAEILRNMGGGSIGIGNGGNPTGSIGTAAGLSGGKRMQ